MTAESKRSAAFGAVVALVAFLVYANSLGNGFVWDDTNVIVANPALKGPAIALFWNIDSTRDYELLPYYRPLTILTFLVGERLHGVEPFPMHLLNILLHAASACLVYYLARSFFRDDYPAVFAGLLFAVHPMNAEAVDFLSGGRNTMLACFFVLGAWLFHRRSILEGKYRFAVIGAAFFTAGLFSKELALASLALILAQEIPPLREKGTGAVSRGFVRLVPYAAGAVCYLGMRWMTLDRLGIQTGILPGFGSEKLLGMYKIPGLGERMLENLYIIPRYLLTVVWPMWLSPRYVIPEHFESLAPQLIFAWVLIIASLGWLLTRGRSRATLFGLAWLIAFWLPVSGIAIFTSAPMADRYMYVAAIGLWLIVADQGRRLLPPGGGRRSYGVAAAALVIAMLAGVTVGRNLDWRSDISLFSRLVRQYPSNPYGHAALGEAYLKKAVLEKGDMATAEEELEKARALNPILPGVNTKLGYIRLARGDSDGAAHYYTVALGVYPLDKEALLNRGIALENLGREKEALEDFRMFLATPGYEFADARPYVEGRIREISR